MNDTLSGLSFVAATKRVLSKYAVFRGRATRSEYWWFTLAATLASLAVSLVFGLFGEDIEGLVSGLLSLALFLPSLAVGVRRLHDIGRSGWWILVFAIPLVVLNIVGVLTVGALVLSGANSVAALFAALGTLLLPILAVLAGGIVLFIFSLLPSQPVDNKYGPAPVPASAAS